MIKYRHWDGTRSASSVSRPISQETGTLSTQRRLDAIRNALGPTCSPTTTTSLRSRAAAGSRRDHGVTPAGVVSVAPRRVRTTRHGIRAGARRRRAAGVRRAVAIVALGILVGVVWFFQGIGVIKGSFMTGEALWAVIGTVCVVAGVALLVRPTRV